MSTITFACSDAQKEEIKAGVWAILKDHYITSAYPNTNVTYKRESKEVYLERLEKLMQNSLCQIEDTDHGVCIAFDSTEDAGMSIASEVYGTSMGYSDSGLTYIVPVFEKIYNQFSSIPFNAHAECADSWVEMEFTATADGKTLKINNIDIQVYNKIAKMIDEEDLEVISEETGVPIEEIEELFL